VCVDVGLSVWVGAGVDGRGCGYGCG